MPNRPKKQSKAGYRAFLGRVFRNPDAATAAYVLTYPAVAAVLGVLVLAVYMAFLARDIPSLQQIENPELSLATVAYTMDGAELARYGRENRSWIDYDSISVHVRNALVATEDKRFFRHWGVDMFRTFSAFTQSALGKLGLPFERQGGSTITQQLARNLYNQSIGFEVSAERKLKEMATAIRLERMYSKPEIAGMYLNTVPFRHNAYGIEAAARTYFDKSSADLDPMESATLVAMLKASTRYDPERNPEASHARRNVVMRLMARSDCVDDEYRNRLMQSHAIAFAGGEDPPCIDEEYYESHRDSTTVVRLRTADVTQSIAPYFAERVRQDLDSLLATRGDSDVYKDGLQVTTTLDSRWQRHAQAAATAMLDGLQAVVDCEWSAASSPRLRFGEDMALYLEDECHTDPSQRWAWFWGRNESLLNDFVREDARFRSMVSQGVGQADALLALRNDVAFMDSLKNAKSRLEVGLLAVNPRNGHVKVWVGGRELARDWYDHVSVAKRQTGSTFKPFVYSTAIVNGYSPDYTYADSRFVYRDPVTEEVWSPENSGGGVSEEMLPLREGLARSLNTITGQLIIDIKPENVVQLARQMGIESPLDPVPALALGTSDTSLLEMVRAYATLANLGTRHDPVKVTRVQNRSGEVLYEHVARPREALQSADAIVVLDMMRDVINQGYGTGFRIRSQFGLTAYDFAGKTGTTQRGADGWFLLMHPELVAGAWIGFNDHRMTFRSTFWGQGAHNALFVVGEFLRRIERDPELGLDADARFPVPVAGHPDLLDREGVSRRDAGDEW